MATPRAPPWRSLSLTPGSSEGSPAPANAPAPASARRSDKRKSVPELIGEALAKEQQEKRELLADIKRLQARMHVPTWVREAACNLAIDYLVLGVREC